MSPIITCPECKGVGKLNRNIGRLHDTIPFSNEHWKQTRDLLSANKVIELEEFGAVIKCLLCQGCGKVFAIPAHIISTGEIVREV